MLYWFNLFLNNNSHNLTAGFEYIFAQNLLIFEKRFIGGRTMTQDYTGHICVAIIIIGIMLMLLVDIYAKNRAILQTYSKKTEVEVPVASVKQEETLAYPYYIDCTQSIDNAQLEQ
jgi:hypothetical protein